MMPEEPSWQKCWHCDTMWLGPRRVCFCCGMYGLDTHDIPDSASMSNTCVATVAELIEYGWPQSMVFSWVYYNARASNMCLPSGLEESSEFYEPEQFEVYNGWLAEMDACLEQGVECNGSHIQGLRERNCRGDSVSIESSGEDYLDRDSEESQISGVSYETLGEMLRPSRQGSSDFGVVSVPVRIGWSDDE